MTTKGNMICWIGSRNRKKGISGKTKETWIQSVV